MELSQVEDRACLNAHVLASRYTDSVRPTSVEIAAALTSYRTALLSQPNLCFIRAKMWWSEVHRVEFVIDSEDVAAAWTRGDLTTGVALLDEALGAAGANGVNPIDEASRLFLVTFRYAVNPENLQVALEGVDGVSPQVVRYDYTEGEEIVLEPPSVFGALDVVFRHGWGDCAVRCDGNHWWRIRVDSDGTSEVVEEWGAAIPSDEIPRMQARVLNECEM